MVSFTANNVLINVSVSLVLSCFLFFGWCDLTHITNGSTVAAIKAMHWVLPGSRRRAAAGIEIGLRWPNLRQIFVVLQCLRWNGLKRKLSFGRPVRN